MVFTGQVSSIRRNEEAELIEDISSPEGSFDEKLSLADEAEFSRYDPSNPESIEDEGDPESDPSYLEEDIDDRNSKPYDQYSRKKSNAHDGTKNRRPKHKSGLGSKTRFQVSDNEREDQFSTESDSLIYPSSPEEQSDDQIPKSQDSDIKSSKYESKSSRHGKRKLNALDRNAQRKFGVGNKGIPDSEETEDQFGLETEYSGEHAEDKFQDSVFPRNPFSGKTDDDHVESSLEATIPSKSPQKGRTMARRKNADSLSSYSEKDTVRSSKILNQDDEEYPDDEKSDEPLQEQEYPNGKLKSQRKPHEKADSGKQRLPTFDENDTSESESSESCSSSSESESSSEESKTSSKKTSKNPAEWDSNRSDFEEAPLIPIEYDINRPTLKPPPPPNRPLPTYDPTKRYISLELTHGTLYQKLQNGNSNYLTIAEAKKQYRQSKRNKQNKKFKKGKGRSLASFIKSNASNNPNLTIRQIIHIIEDHNDINAESQKSLNHLNASLNADHTNSSVRQILLDIMAHKELAKEAEQSSSSAVVKEITGKPKPNNTQTTGSNYSNFTFTSLLKFLKF